MGLETQRLFEPTIALVAVAVLSIACRWTFAPVRGQRHRTGRLPRPASRDFGLLVQVATLRTRDDAEDVLGALRGRGIRSTVAPATGAPDGPDEPADWQVLVFAADARAAQDALALPPRPTDDYNG
jgi:hypothetical protein